MRNFSRTGIQISKYILKRKIIVKVNTHYLMIDSDFLLVDTAPSKQEV